MIIDYDLALTGSAQFSDCRKYRYTLRRSFAGSVLEPPHNPIYFIGLNPSTADAFANDPTIRREIGFAQKWGFSDLIMLNVFAIRETDSQLLAHFADPLGPENESVFASIPESATVVAAWGAHKLARVRTERMLALLSRLRLPLMCLGQNNDGSPKHPLYVPAKTELKAWRKWPL